MAGLTAERLAERVGDVRTRIERAGGSWRDITLVAVTKGFGPEAARLAGAAGLFDLGENYAASLAEKVAAVPDPEIRWHFIGAVQRNKVAGIAARVHLWHGLDRVAEGTEIAKRAPGAAVLVQVNVTGEPQKGGVAPEAAPALVAELRTLGLDVQGLMAIGPAGPATDARPGFRRLAVLAGQLALPVRSMGMSNDLEVAVQEGTTMVRVGTALFGPRPEAASARR